MKNNQKFTLILLTIKRVLTSVMDPFIYYTDVKARVVQALARVTTFVKASDEYTKDFDNLKTRAKVE